MKDLKTKQKLSNEKKIILEAEKIINKENVNNIAKKENQKTKNSSKKDISKNVSSKDNSVKNFKPKNISAKDVSTKKELEKNVIPKNNLQNDTIRIDNAKIKEMSKKTEAAKTEINKKALPIRKTNNKKLKKLLIVLFFTIIFVLAILSFIFGLITSNSNKIISGISVNGIDISNLSKEEAVNKLNLQLSNNLSKEIILTRGEYSTSFNTSTIEPSFNIENAVDTAYSYGRSENNIFINNFKIISTYFNNQNITPSLTYNDDAFNTAINNLNNELPDKVINSTYKIEDNNLIIYNSTNGYRIQTDKLKNNIILSITNNTNTVEIPVEQFEAENIDIEAIYNEIHKEAVDATFTTNPYEIHKEEEGLDFAITLDEAKKLISQEQESYTIPLKVLKPRVTVKSLGQEAFPDLLATYSTTYSTGNANRSTNISLATKSVNGCVLMPGETFSYNNTVGQRTAARGYKEAGVYVNGEVTTGLGGGICQVSSTLYNAVLLSNLEVVDRSNHTFKPTYVPAGQDATVSWGAPDFKFKNNRNYPIRILATAGSGRVTFNIYGLKTNDDYQVKIESYEVSPVPFSTQYQNNSSLPAGTQKVLQAGSNGCKTQTYKILYKNGVEVSRTLINSDTYKPHNQIVAVGTGATQTPSTQTQTTEPQTTETPASSENTNNQEQSTNTDSTENADSPSVEITY